MKNKTRFFLLFLCSIIAITSCNKKNSPDPYTAPFAKETVDQGKANLSQAGQDMISQVSQMKDVAGASAIQSFTDCNSKSDPASLKKSGVLNPIFNTESVISGTGKFVSVLNALNTSGNDPQTIQEFFDTYKGIYNWNSSTEQWTKTVDNTQMVFNFPKLKGGATNDAQMKITYTGKTGTSVLDNYTGDLPVMLDITISANNNKIAEYSFTASYDSQGIPTSLESFIALYPFKIGVSWAYSTSSVSVNYYFRNDSKSIIEFGGGVGGNFDKNTIDTASSPESILANANAHFQISNVKLAGRVDYTALAKDMRNAENITVDSLMAKAEADAFNKDVSLVLVYADSNTKIAQAESYVSKNTDIYWPEYVYYSSEIRFVFADGTKGDMQSYFNEGFTDLQNSFNTLVDDLNAKFGSGK